MALKRINESPTIGDTIIFDILTPDANGCYIANPYKISQIVIYYITRDFSGNNIGEFTTTSSTDSGLQADYEAARARACLFPTPSNLAEAERLQNQLTASLDSNTYYYKEAVAIAMFGNDDSEVWLDTGDPVPDAANAASWHVKNINETVDGDTQYGHWELEWSPAGQREGDYVICWTWTPLIGGDNLSAHEKFALLGDTQITTSIPTHFTKPGKYETLLNNYLPEVFKIYWSDNDVSPEVLQEFNNSVAQGFSLLEDLANQTVDLLDANAIHESMLVYLGNIFGLKLRSGDPTLWRRQIKRAVPVFKKKGTFRGLSEALAQAGIELKKFTKLWQVVSPYTWQEVLDVINDGDTTFTLSKMMVLPVDLLNFELYYRGVSDDIWTPLTVDYIQAVNIGSDTIITWVGHLLSVNPIVLYSGDSIRILYKFNDVPDAAAQAIEDYIRTLPLADQRDERDQNCPLKNWNVRLIEEDDSLFDLIVPTRHPYVDPLIFGWVRTEFPYSENIYNVEEYNGSSRESRSPCDIDCDFMDSCTSCQSSKYNIDLKIEQLCNDRIRESLEILAEYTPFHAVLHQMNFEGLVNEFVEPPFEQVQALIQFSGQDVLISGNAQMFFNRVTENGLHSIRRDALATSNLVVGGPLAWVPALAYNDMIVLFCPDLKLDTLGWDKDHLTKNILEILTGVHAGIYNWSNPDGYMVTVAGVPPAAEPLSQSSFNFRLSVDLYENATTTLNQEFKFDDLTQDFLELWDVNNPREVYDGSWRIELSAYPYPDPPPFGPNNDVYTIVSITTDSELLIDGYAHPLNSLPIVNASGITYTIRNDTGYLITTGVAGSWTKTQRGIVDFSSEVTLEDVRSLFEIGHYVLYGGTQYEIVGFIPNDNHRLYIGNYTSGNIVGVTTHVYQRLASNQVGYLQYKNLILQTIVNYETILGILNGANAPVDPNLILDSDLWKESFLVVIQNFPPVADDYYAISQINGTIITLNGPYHQWKTPAAGGTPVLIHIYQYIKQPLTIPERNYPPMPEHTFDSVDRRGNDVIQMSIETATPFMPPFLALNIPDNSVSDVLGQNESITYFIEHKGKHD